MKKSILLMMFLLASASFTLAQTNSSSADTSRFETFVGYTRDQDQREPSARFNTVLGFTNAQLQSIFGTTLNSNSGRTNMNGVNVSFTGYVTKNLGITGDFSFAGKTETQPVGARGSSVRRRKYNFLAGPQYKFHNSSRVEPFVHALFGAAHLSNRTTPDNSGIPFTGLTVQQIDDNYTAFAMGIGGGIDVRLNKRIKLRLIQVDYNPVFSKTRNFVTTKAVFAGTTLTGPTVVQGYRRDNIRLSFGIVF